MDIKATRELVNIQFLIWEVCVHLEQASGCCPTAGPTKTLTERSREGLWPYGLMESLLYHCCKGFVVPEPGRCTQKICSHIHTGHGFPHSSWSCTGHRIWDSSGNSSQVVQLLQFLGPPPCSYRCSDSESHLETLIYLQSDIFILFVSYSSDSILVSGPLHLALD